MTVAPSEEAARQVVVCDINPEMLAVGRDRADKLFTGLQRDMVPQSAITNAVHNCANYTILGGFC